METLLTFEDVEVTRDGHVALIELRRPPHNFFGGDSVRAIADAVEHIDRETDVRAIVLASEGKSFSAGNLLGGARDPNAEPPKPGDRHGQSHVYNQAARIIGADTPIVAAVQGPAIGGGMGLALVADFRIGCAEVRFSANFPVLGFHPGFGITSTLPRIVGQQQAWRLLYTGARINGEEAHRIGLLDELVPLDDVRERAFEFAHELAAVAPLAVRSIRRTMRMGFVDEFRLATAREKGEQEWLRETQDFREGMAAMNDRRTPEFHGE
jgi:enoyl-CoA hydratase/carnithine racemase